MGGRSHRARGFATLDWPHPSRNDALSAAIADDEAGVSEARVTLSDMTLYVDGSWEG